MKCDKRIPRVRSIHKRGEGLLMSIYGSRLIPIKKMTAMAEIIEAAFAAGKKGKKRK